MRTPQLRAVSPLVGLRRRSLGEVEVLAQSVAVTAPSAAAATTPSLVAASAGFGTLYSYLIAIMVIAMVTVAVRQFSSRLAAPGSLYTFTARGLGTRPAVVAGAGLIVGYAALSMAATVLASWYALTFAARLGLPGSSSGVAAAGVIVLTGLAVTGCLFRGIGVSSRVALAVESVAVLLTVGVLLAVLSRLVVAVEPGGAPGFQPILAASGANLGGVIHGAGLAVASFVGFESAVALGGEARRPLLAIPRSVGRTVLAVSAIYLLAGLVQLASLGTSLGDAGAPLVDLAAAMGAPLLAGALDLAVVCSGFACAAGAATALARLLFSMAREHGDRTVLGHADERNHAPDRAIGVSMVVVVGVPFVLVATGGGLAPMFAGLITVATVGYLLAYVLVCAALPAFLRRIGELTALPAAIGAGGALLLTLMLVGLVLPASGAAWVAAPAVLGGVVAVALALHEVAVRRDLNLRFRMGLYDETILSDLHPSQR